MSALVTGTVSSGMCPICRRAFIANGTGSAEQLRAILRDPTHGGGPECVIPGSAR